MEYYGLFGQPEGVDLPNKEENSDEDLQTDIHHAGALPPIKDEALEELLEMNFNEEEEGSLQEEQEEKIDLKIDLTEELDNDYNIDHKEINDEVGGMDSIGKSTDPITRKALLELSAKQAKLSNLHKKKIKLERVIEDEEIYLISRHEYIDNVIESNNQDLKKIVHMIDKVEDDNKEILRKVGEVDNEQSDLESKINHLKRKRAALLEEYEQGKERRKEYVVKKKRLEDDMEKELRINIKRGNSINTLINEHRDGLRETNKAIEELPYETSKPNDQLLKFISEKIREKEQELECPVCMEVASAPILMCPEQHLICSTCKPKVSECPVCREKYEDVVRRHRYAEKAAEELERLKNQKYEAEQSNNQTQLTPEVQSKKGSKFDDNYQRNRARIPNSQPCDESSSPSSNDEEDWHPPLILPHSRGSITTSLIGSRRAGEALTIARHSV